MNFLSFLLLGIIVIYLIFSLVVVYRNKKQGKGCSGSCASCSKKCR